MRKIKSHLAMAFVLAAVGCGGGGGGGKQGGSADALRARISDAVALSDTDTLASTVVSGRVPSNGTDSPVTFGNSASASYTAVRGGSVIVSVATPAAVQRLLVGVEGTDGHYAFESAASQARSVPNEPELSEVGSYLIDRTVFRGRRSRDGSYLYDIVLTLPTNVAQDSFVIDVVAKYKTRGNGLTQPAAATINVNQTAQSSQSLQVNLSWGVDVDLDLHVGVPDGSEVGYNNRSAGGGELDLDSNPGCAIDGIRSENVTWASGTAPSGVYSIRPNYYSACQAGDIRYTLTVNNSGYTRTYVNTFASGEANNNAGTSEAKLLATCILPSKDTESGVVSRMLIAEVKGPLYSSYDYTDSEKAMRAVKACVVNRLADRPGRFNASGATTLSQIIFAPGQFAGFIGGISSAIDLRVSQNVTPPATSPANLAAYKQFWQAALDTTANSVADPYAGVTAVGSVATVGGTYGFRTAGSSDPGGSFVAVPAPNGQAGGQQFYTLKTGS